MEDRCSDISGDTMGLDGRNMYSNDRFYYKCNLGCDGGGSEIPRVQISVVLEQE